MKSKHCKVLLRLAVIVPALLLPAYGVWYGANWLCARQLSARELIQIGDHGSLDYLLRWSGRDLNLVESDGSPQFQDSLLMYAVRLRRHECARVLLKHGADPDGAARVFAETGREYFHEHAPLASAASNGDLAMCALLLESGADPDAPADAYHRTAINYASIKGQWEIAQLLLEHGANPNCPRDDGVPPRWPPPIVVAAKQYEWNAVALCLDHGADPNVDDRSGRSVLALCLMQACATDAENRDVVLRLIAKKADPSSADALGVTPFHWAAGTDVTIVRAMLNAGANVNARTSDDGHTPLDCAEEPEIKQFLRKHDAKTGAELKAEAVNNETKK